MKNIFRTSKNTMRTLFIIELVLITAPGITAFLIVEEELWLLLLVTSIVYLGFSPLIIIMGRLIWRYNSISISIEGEHLEYSSGNSGKIIPWCDVESLNFDYIAMSGKYGSVQYYELYEVVSKDFKFRFMVNLNKREIKRLDEFHLVNNFTRKAFLFDSYGLYLSRIQSRRLLSFLRDYTGLEFQRRKGLF